ncbi:HAMP domain-containing sensor histidine kinase [Rhodococcus sp. T2V]|uniref:sensor histidine kinase n=1 Tax=Rhodococcus sp. T2V TaxID=3034164 RepID=UPI0023E29E13|nr:HAMP domain-containing sensor histidine kinase [Rhodococcus sp. T2V]MDF3306251.1 HAMP domain-containing sensor histidine kinase [Rhodococcus sp. T2V]
MADDRGSVLRRLRARLGTVRFRTTLAAVVIVGIALLAGAIVLVAALRNTLIAEVVDVSGEQAQEFASALEFGLGQPDLDIAAADEQLVQVLDASGAVVRSSRAIAGEPAVARLQPGAWTRFTPSVDEDEFIAVAAPANTTDGPLVVIVARPLVGVSETTRQVERMLQIGLPALLALVAATTWYMSGRALAPVERIRSDVDEISAAALHRRVPVPAGGDEIARLAATMNRMLGRLEHAAQTQHRFISDVSHELRSPVAAIRHRAEVALAHPDKTDATEFAETVLAENLRVQRLVEDLLLLARVDENALRLHREPVDLDDLVFEEADRLRSDTGIEVDTSGVSGGQLIGDSAALRRLLRNLGENATRHARHRVALRVVEHGGTVRLTIDDDGPGIAEEDRGRIFERFVRLDDARARDDGGSGLGLAIVAELARAHGAEITVGRSDLGGARFELVFPAAT